DAPVADRAEGALAAGAEVLHVDERDAAARPLEQLDRVDARPPGPAEVELEEEQQLEQPVEEAAPVLERTQLAVVVVEAELEAERALGADGVEHQADGGHAYPAARTR